jgi:L-asparaginase
MPNGEDLVGKLLQTRFSSLKARCVTLEPKDSKLIDLAYREHMLALIIEAPESLILVTHGTDTILASADFFYKKFKEQNVSKTLVLTGAMTPLSNGAESDGYRNLAFALDYLASPAASQPNVGIVLSDFDANKDWTPVFYSYLPDQFVKHYDEDGRYNRILRVS